MRLIKNPCLLLFLIAVSFASCFYSGRFAIDDSLKYRPLANGWVSIYAPIQMDDSLTVLEKIEETIKADIVHGRFRPAFFFYTTVSYALSPIIHGKINSAEKRKYRELMTGDLQLYDFMLLTSLATAACMMTLLIHGYTHAKLISLLPLIFVPLSPSFTENLLQNYIDSQEIPLVLWVSLWLFCLFKTLHQSPQKRATTNVYFAFSLLFFFIAFLTKETMIVVTCPLLILTFLALQKKYRGNIPQIISQKRYILSTFVLSIICSIGIIAIVSINKHGYASAYQSANLEEYKVAIIKLWSCMSRFTLNNVYGFIPIGLSFLMLFTQRGKLINGRSISDHLSISLFLFSLSYGFLFILIPWDPILIKYVFPSVFFFSFLVAYSLGILFHWVRSFNNKFLRYAAYGLLVPYLYLFMGYQKNAAQESNYLFYLANYGVSALGPVVESIDKELQNDAQKMYKVFAGFEAEGVWKYHIEWSALHMKRMLNFDLNYNMMDYEGRAILNTAMPKDELTSYVYSPEQKNLFLSEKRSDLDTIKFNIIYLGFLKKVSVPDNLSYGQLHYQIAGEVFEYPPKHGLPAFLVAKYLPAAF